jgi:hypothetical protein
MHVKSLNSFFKYYCGTVFFILLLGIPVYLPAQITLDKMYTLKEKENFDQVGDSLLQKQLAYFCDITTGTYWKKVSIKLDTLPLYRLMGNEVVFADGNCTIKIAKRPFNKAMHKLLMSNEGGYNCLAAIDSLPIWGTDCDTPRYEYNYIDIEIDGKKVAIPPSATNGLYEPSLHFNKVYRTKNRRRYFIHVWNSDGAGAYELTFIIDNGKYLRRVADDGF